MMQAGQSDTIFSKIYNIHFVISYTNMSLEQQIDVDYYKILGVPRNATLQQICARYAFYHSATGI